MRRPLLAGCLAIALLGCGVPFPVEEDVTLLPPPPPDSTVGPPGPSLTPQAPDAFILSPLDGAVVAPGVSLLLRGVLSDDDDALDSLTARWERDDGEVIEVMTPTIDGLVETSFTIPTEGLEGLRLVAVDPGGLSKSVSVSLVANSPPGVVEVAIVPESPSANDDLLAVVEEPAEDPDRDATGVANVFQWYVDGELAGIEGALVDASLTRAGEVWSVSVRAYDGFALGPQAEAEVSIGLAGPTVFVSAPLGADGDLTCAVSEEGSLEQATEASWYWTIGDGAEVKTTKELQSDAVSHCDWVSCRVELSLGDDLVSSEPSSLLLPYGSDCEVESPCFEKLCAEAGGCSAVTVDEACEDGDACTVGDTCVDGACISGEALACEAADNAAATCVDGECELICEPGWLDCDEEYGTGCELESPEEGICPE